MQENIYHNFKGEKGFSKPDTQFRSLTEETDSLDNT